MTTYAEKLKHPKWQKLRLEILQRDDFACRQCGEREITLHVHHAYYRANADPWDYPAHSLKTLCADCHETETKALPELVADAVSMLKEAGADSYAFGCIAASFERVTVRPIATDEWDVIADILKAFLASRDACGELWQEWLSRREATRFSLGDEDAAS